MENPKKGATAKSPNASSYIANASAMAGSAPQSAGV